jgi:hypothetical protein
VRGTANSTKAFRLQQLARRALVEQAGDDDVRFQQQHVLGAARQDRETARLVGGKGLPGLAGISAEAQNLLGIGEREQQLIAADVHRDDARRACRVCDGGAESERCKQCSEPPHQISAQGTITVSR